jgi:glycosyltransferase involved in cell wall biosynthesis
MTIQKVSVVIPAKHEHETIGPVLERLNDAVRKLPQYKFETIVVIDNPEDLTNAAATQHGAGVIINQAGRGKGNALYTGFRAATGEAIATFDSDGSHYPEDIGRFLEEIEKGAGLVIGSRVLGGSDDHNVVRLFANALFTMMFSILFGTTLMDTLNGYKVFVKDVVNGYRPKARGFDVEVEIVARAVGKGLKVVEIASHEDRRSGGHMKSNAVRDGFFILWACFREGMRFRFRQLFRLTPA